MVDYTYTYLISTGLFFIIWLFFFLTRKDYRKQMLIVAIIFGIIGIIASPFHFGNWWIPMHINDANVGIEDFLFAFFVAGIASVVYEKFFDKKIRKKSVNKKFYLKLLMLIITGLIIFYGGIKLLGINSFYPTMLAIIIPTLIILYKRRDLIKNSVFSGILTVILSIPVYYLLELITPGFIENFWSIDFSWYSLKLFNVPIMEHLFYFFFGAFVGPFYEYCQEAKLIKIKNK